MLFEQKSWRKSDEEVGDEKEGAPEKEGAENYLMKTTWPSVILKPLQEEDLHPWRSKEQ